ncbi:MAG: hypothetical protein QW091_02350 [Candidatus Micrarchaeaceae archaeon]
MSMNKLLEAAAALNNNPSEANWKAFSSALKKSKARFYKITYERGAFKEAEDLKKSYAEIYDSKKKRIAKVPIFKKTKKAIEGATIYLKGLDNLPVVK